MKVYLAVCNVFFMDCERDNVCSFVPGCNTFFMDYERDDACYKLS